MTLLTSKELPLGTTLPPFELPDADGRPFRADRLLGTKGLLVVFTCNHCPYANAQWPRFVRLAREARELGIATVAINSNIHPDYPEDAVARMPAKIRELGIDFPYLVDASQEVARAFQAQCTPDPYLFDGEGRLVYHGRLDDNWREDLPTNRSELREAVLAQAAGKPPLSEQPPSMGCSIKWRE